MTSSLLRAAPARRSLAAALALVFSGCSFTTVQRPRSWSGVEDPRVVDDCTTSPAAPIADSVLTGAALVAAYVAMVVAFVDETTCWDTTTSSCHSGDTTPAVALAATGAVFGASSIYGFVSTAQCRHRIVAGGRCANGDFYACQRLRPGWIPPPGWRAGGILEPRAPAPPPTQNPTPAWPPPEPSPYGAAPPEPSPR